MLLIFSMPVLIRHLWQLKTFVFLHWCLINALLLGCVGQIKKCMHTRQLMFIQNLSSIIYSFLSEMGKLVAPSVANAKFSLLKLLIYEPYYLCLS